MATEGDVIDGRYELLRKLGRGGQGEMWAARDSRVGKKVAIKLPYPSSAADPKLVVRFENEARLAGRVSHPNVATVTDSGVDPAHGPYLCQELITGPSLADRLRDGEKVDVGEARTLAFRLGQALLAIHGEGIAHRDLCSSNIIINPERGAVIVDFGFATDHSNERPRSDTHDSAYTAPERQGDSVRQLDGEERFACDYYSLGVVLYEALTLRTPSFAPGPVFSDRMLPATLTPLIRLLLLADPTERLRAKDLLAHLAPPASPYRSSIHARIADRPTRADVATALGGVAGVGLLATAGYLGTEAILRATG